MVFVRVTSIPQGTTALLRGESGRSLLPGCTSRLHYPPSASARVVSVSRVHTAPTAVTAQGSTGPRRKARQIHTKHRGVRTRVEATQMSSATVDRDIEAYGKAVPGTGQPSSVRGDCPFSQRTYLELEEKGIAYKSTYIQEGPNEEKPKWFMEHNPSGLMPVLRDGDRWIQDSDKIANYLEEKFPEPSLRTPKEYEHVGENIFPTFTEWLQSKNIESPAKNEYVSELRALNEHLKQKGPYIAGDRITDADLKLGPRLRHAVVTLAHYMDFHLSEEFAPVKDYMKRLEQRESFKKTTYPDQTIIEGWKKKFDLPDKVARGG